MRSSKDTSNFLIQDNALQLQKKQNTFDNLKLNKKLTPADLVMKLEILYEEVSTVKNTLLNSLIARPEITNKLSQTAMIHFKTKIGSLVSICEKLEKDIEKYAHSPALFNRNKLPADHDKENRKPKNANKVAATSKAAPKSEPAPKGKYEDRLKEYVDGPDAKDPNTGDKIHIDGIKDYQSKISDIDKKTKEPITVDTDRKEKFSSNLAELDTFKKSITTIQDKMHSDEARIYSDKDIRYEERIKTLKNYSVQTSEITKLLEKIDDIKAFVKRKEKIWSPATSTVLFKPEPSLPKESHKSENTPKVKK